MMALYAGPSMVWKRLGDKHEHDRPHTKRNASAKDVAHDRNDVADNDDVLLVEPVGELPPKSVAGIIKMPNTAVSMAMFPALIPSFWLRIIVSMGQTIEPMFVTIRPKKRT